MKKTKPSASTRLQQHRTRARPAAVDGRHHHRRRLGQHAPGPWRRRRRSARPRRARTDRRAPSTRADERRRSRSVRRQDRACRQSSSRRMAESAVVTSLRIPADLLPGDGRFGCGPAKIRPQSVRHLAADGPGCSAPRTGRPRSGIWSVPSAPGWASCSPCPDGYEVVLGNGGSSLFWDVARVLADRAAQRPRLLRGVLGEVRRRGRRGPAPERAERGHAPAGLGRAARGGARGRRVRLGAQRDLDRRAGAGAADRRRRPRAR